MDSNPQKPVLLGREHIVSQVNERGCPSSEQFDTNGVISTHPPLLNLLFLLTPPTIGPHLLSRGRQSIRLHVLSSVALDDGRQTLNLTEEERFPGFPLTKAAPPLSTLETN